MSIEDSRSSWQTYWKARPASHRVWVIALLAGLTAIYSVMGLLALAGIWRNNLFRMDTNWPWALPLGGLNVLGERFKRTILLHGIIFLPLLALQGLMAMGSDYPFSKIWFAPASLLGIAIVNIVAFKIMAKAVAGD